MKKIQLEKKGKTVGLNILSNVIYYKNRYLEAEKELKEYLLEQEEIEIELLE